MNADDLNENAAEADPIRDVPETTATHVAILAERVEYLLGLCERLAQENQVLREHNAALLAEREALSQKYEQARARVEAMIVRMKDLEQAS